MTDQEIRLKFGEMNAGEMRLARALVAWHEREIAKLKEGLAEAQQIAESWSKHIHPATHDIIVSTKDEEIAALKTALAESEKQFQDKVYEIACLLDECDKAQGILKACLSVMPFGNIKTHTFENLPGRIADLASEIASLSLENERLESELAALRTPILADDSRSLIDIYGDAFDVARVKRKLPMKECCDSGFKAVEAAVLAQAVRRMEAVPVEELCDAYESAYTSYGGMGAVRTRLIAAARGEGQQPIKGLEALTKERCLRIAEIEGDSTIAAGRPDVCPHAAPHVFCETCKASPCPIGIPAKREGQAKPVVVNEPDLSGESEKQDEPAQTQQEPAQPWTPAVGDVVRLKSGGPKMTVTHVDPLSLMCAWMNAGNELQVEPITTLCLTPAQP